jgi:hypothetical protein
MHPIVGPVPPEVDVPLLPPAVEEETWEQSYEKPPLPAEVVHNAQVQFEPPYETEHPSSVPVASMSAFTHSASEPDPSQSDTSIRRRDDAVVSSDDGGSW